MSSLWMEQKYNNKKMPSPANYGLFKNPLSPGNKNPYLSIKGIFLLASRQKAKGSMTIEAALLLPLFLFFFLHLSAVTEMLQLHGKVEAALWNTGNQLALYAAASPETVSVLPDIGISYLWVKQQVEEYLEKEYLERSPIVYGASGLNFLRSDYQNEEECVDILVTYEVEPPLTLFPFPYRRMANRYYARIWTGYDVSNAVNRGGYVYMTPYGEVWHRVPNCTYIFHEVKSVSIGFLGEKKNAEGRIYEPCDFCSDQLRGDCVFVTVGGEKYHHDQKCTAIFKEVIALEKEKGQQYRACSRCVEEREK